MRIWLFALVFGMKRGEGIYVSEMGESEEEKEREVWRERERWGEKEIDVEGVWNLKHNDGVCVPRGPLKSHGQKLTYPSHNVKV